MPSGGELLGVRSCRETPEDARLPIPPAVVQASAAGQILRPAMSEVPAGTFIAGEQEEAGGEQGTLVELPAFCIGVYPVTNAEYARFVEDGGYTERWRECWTDVGWSYVRDYGFSGPHYWSGVNTGLLDHPVVGVSWYEAWAYCSWLAGVLGRRFVLPTDAHWEKAARGESGRRYPWGDEWREQCCNSAEAGLGCTSPVSHYPGGRSPYGACDMAGNVWEWCFTPTDACECTGEYGTEDIDRVWVRVVRGGSWNDTREYVRCASRAHFSEGFRGDHLGFRVAELP